MPYANEVTFFSFPLLGVHLFCWDREEDTSFHRSTCLCSRALYAHEAQRQRGRALYAHEAQRQRGRVLGESDSIISQDVFEEVEIF